MNQTLETTLLGMDFLKRLHMELDGEQIALYR